MFLECATILRKIYKELIMIFLAKLDITPEKKSKEKIT